HGPRVGTAGDQRAVSVGRVLDSGGGGGVGGPTTVGHQRPRPRRRRNSPGKKTGERRRPRDIDAAGGVTGGAIGARLRGGNADRPDAAEVEPLDQRAPRWPRGEPPEPPIISSQGLDRRRRPRSALEEAAQGEANELGA